MDLTQWALPAGLSVAGIGTAVTVGMVLGHRRRAGEQNATAEERDQLALRRRQAWQRRMAVIALAVGCVMMFVLAGIAAWLSFGAQREYAHAHNGGNWDAATGFALLLDAGALSLSLIRFFEALTLRSSAITRILLLAFVSASAIMNLLHAPGAGAGSAFLAVVPPLVYAILLEMLLFKVEQVIMGRQQRRKTNRERAYSLLLWLPWPIGAPVRMWRAWRAELLATVDNVRVIGSQRPRPQTADPTPRPPTAPAATQVTLEKVTPARLQASEPAPVAAATPTAHILTGAAQSPAATGEKTTAPQATEVLAPPATRALAAASEAKDEAAAPEEASMVQDLQAAILPTAAKQEPEPEPEPEPEATAGNRDETPQHRDGLPEAKDTGTTRPEGLETADDEAKDEEPEAQHEHPVPGEGDEESRGQRQTLQIDLSALPQDEKPRQRAERIYVAHQVAGLPLDKADLGKWAGYTNARSGGNEYRRLEKEYGPIQEREGAAEIDLDWDSFEPQPESGPSQVAA
ncbi:DUF2637 domain-containing protein [Streptomyces sp. NPDC059193]|uniref:DUF2637 domain-containing protein n=1 Tax=Streptomyces sp. NPDC059193 TaxID=3346763 RepID=UPI003691B598